MRSEPPLALNAIAAVILARISLMPSFYEFVIVIINYHN